MALRSSRHRSSATPLAAAYAALILYASLYPFDGWRWPPGLDVVRALTLPRTSWQLPFDIGSNFFGYFPLGGLLLVALRRSGVRARVALLAALLAPAALSYGCEVLQHLVPGRVPAREDWWMNAAGAAFGVLLAAMGHRWGLDQRWEDLRARWFVADSAGPLALLALWPVGLLFPAPLPLGLGQVGERLRDSLTDLLEGVPWAAELADWLAAPAAAVPLHRYTEALIVAAGLLGPALLAYTVMPRGWRRLVLAAAVPVLGIAAMVLSTALNFGPRHAWGWVAPSSVDGLLLGTLLVVAAAGLPRRLMPGLGLIVLTGLVVGIAQAPANPYFALSLQGWEQGRFVRFHGLAQWVGWLWPYVAMAVLLGRLMRPEHLGGRGPLPTIRP